MIDLVSIERAWNGANNKPVVELQSDSAPTQLPENGEGIDGLSAEITFAPGSTFMVLSPFKVYRRGRNGWYEI